MQLSKLTFYPPISTSEEMSDLFSRAAWFFARLRGVELQFLLKDSELRLACSEIPEILGDDFEQLRVELLFKTSFLPANDWKGGT